MEILPLEIKRIIWSNVTSDEDLKSCAFVNREWYIGSLHNMYRNGGARFAPFFFFRGNTTHIIDIKEPGLNLIALHNIAGDAEKLLALFTSDVIQSQQLQDLCVSISPRSVSEKVVDQLFDKLGEFRIDRLELWGERGPKISIKMTASVSNFLAQLTQLKINRAYCGSEIFQYVSNLEILIMGDMYVNCKDYTYNYDGTVAEREDRFVAHDYLGEICENVKKHVKALKSVTFRDDEVVLQGLTSKGLEQIANGGQLERLTVEDSTPEKRPDANIFTLNLDGIRDFSKFSRIKRLKGLSIYSASTLSKLGLACQQLEAVEMQIKVNFSKVGAPKETILFPNLIESDERVVSTSRSKCVCSFVRKHMPKAKFYRYGIFCCHCVERYGANMDVPDDPMYPTWTGFVEKDCPNLKDIQIDLYIPADSYFEQCD